LHVRFRIGDLALFIRVSPPSEDSSKNAIFLAFNEEQPHYYLSEESARLAGGSAAYLVARLVFVDRCVASEGLNPFGLELGADYHLCTVIAMLEAGSEAPCPPQDDAVISPWFSTKISCDRFTLSDIALFFHTGAHESFLAFNCGCPHYYLSKDSLASTTNGRHCAYIFGEIVLITEKIASEQENIFQLQIGTIYYEVTIAVLGSG